MLLAVVFQRRGTHTEAAKQKHHAKTGRKKKQQQKGRPKHKKEPTECQAAASQQTHDKQLVKQWTVTPKGVLPLALCHASATHEGP